MIVPVLAVLSLVFADSETDKAYAPYNVSCPENTNFVRDADSISHEEADWLKGRDEVTRPALVDWLNKSNLTDFDANSFLSNDTIRVGLAFSGGGYRAMLNGAGQFAAFDNRTQGSTESGHMGGLVQAATYVTGLSGGNWLLSSLVINNWTSVDDLRHSNKVWDFSHSIVNPGGINVFKTGSYWDDVADMVKAKGDAGFNTSITDIWGRCLSYQFFEFGDYGGANVSYHYVRDYDAFTSHQMPFPIHVADGRAPNTAIVDTNSTCFEFNPFELGSWDPSVYAFTDIQYLGSEVENGKPTGDQCVNGFDNAGFLTGTSSSLFNQFILQLNSSGISGAVYDLAHKILTSLGNDGDDIAVYAPNPFYGLETVQNSITRNKELDLVDGGEDGQNVPLYPLIQPAREVDIVFAMDNSADTSDSDPQGANWANGTSLVATYHRQFGLQGNGTIFPYVPSAEGFVYGGLTEQPVFFGCDRDNLTSLFNSSVPESERHYPPVVIYMANSRHSYDGNTSTFKMSYETDELNGLLVNGYDLITQNNSTLDSEWRTCVACAVILREQQRRGVSPSEQCQKCFTNYCWNGEQKTSSDGKWGRRDGKSNIVASTEGKGNKKKNAASSLSINSLLALAVSALVVLA